MKVEGVIHTTVAPTGLYIDFLPHRVVGEVAVQARRITLFCSLFKRVAICRQERDISLSGEFANV
jgi:hypothetical protein